MKIERTLYNILLPVAGAVARLAAPFNEKIARGLEERRGFRERWTERAAALGHDGVLLWFHVSSVGEFLQAKPVMDLLAARSGGGIEIALTFFSPSGLHYYHRHDRSRPNRAIRFVEYLPVDTIGNVRFCLDTLRPDMIVYVKFDLWPNLIIEAASRDIPQILISATLSPGSRRLSPIARGFYGGLYERLTAIAAISEEDAERFRAGAGARCEIITAGDTRFDQVCERIDTSTATLPAQLHGADRTWLIAGSTWPRDEAVVIPGFSRILERFPAAGLILAPHEPTAARLEAIDAALERERLPFSLLSRLAAGEAVNTPVIVADGVGYLAELYRTGRVAYVGGSFTTGVHNVMEPAVLGLPVLFGPRIDNSYEARRLVALEVGQIVRTPAEFYHVVSAMLADEDLIERWGRVGSEFIRSHCGAARHCVDLIEAHLKHAKTERSSP